MALMGNGFNPTDVIMHPLVWVVFARNAMIGNGLSYGALGGNNVHPNGAIQGTPAAFGMANSGDGQRLIMSPDQVQNRLPVPLQVNFSPWVKFDKTTKKFDMYNVDCECEEKEEELSPFLEDMLSMDTVLMDIKPLEIIGIEPNGKTDKTMLIYFNQNIDIKSLPNHVLMLRRDL